jgi:hypothetical protein
MRYKNVKSAIIYQFRKPDWFKQWVIKRNAWGIFSKHSHTKKDGVEKQKYNTEASALRAAEAMQKRYEGKFACYKCMFCDGFHVGKQLKP